MNPRRNLDSPSPPAQSAVSFWRFIKIIRERRPIRYHRSRLWILVWIQSPPPPLLRGSFDVSLRLWEKEDDSLYRFRFLILVWISKMILCLCPFSSLRPLPFFSSLCYLFVFWAGDFWGPPPPPPPPPPPLASTRLRSHKHILIPCPTPDAQGFNFKAINYGQISIQGPALGPLVGSQGGESPRKLRGFRRLITVKMSIFCDTLLFCDNWKDTIWRGVQGAEPPPPKKKKKKINKNKKKSGVLGIKLPSDEHFLLIPYNSFVTLAEHYLAWGPGGEAPKNPGVLGIKLPSVEHLRARLRALGGIQGAEGGFRHLITVRWAYFDALFFFDTGS